MKKWIFAFQLIGLVCALSARAELCEKMEVLAPKTRPIVIPKLRLATYNMEKFLSRDDMVSAAKRFGGMTGNFSRTSKSNQAYNQFGQIINAMAPDILTIQEVGSNALRILNEGALKGEYFPIMGNGRDPQGLRNAILVHRTLPLHFKYQQFGKESWTDPTTGQSKFLFPRDLIALYLSATEDDAPFLVIIAHHGKAMREGETLPLRRAQFEFIANLKAKIEKKYEGVPVVVSGDFNMELETLFNDFNFLKGSFADPFLDHYTPEQRYYLTTHQPRGRGVPTRIDGFLISPSLARQVTDAQVYLRQSTGSPSDHNPVFMDIDFTRR